MRVERERSRWHGSPTWSGDDLIAIDADDWPKLRVVLEMVFGVGERDGLNRRAADSPRDRVVVGDRSAATDATSTATPRPPCSLSVRASSGRERCCSPPKFERA
jgi:hypothetical protein